MRRLMWFALGFGAACTVGAYLIQRGFLLLGLVCLLSAAAAVVLRKRYAWLRPLAVVLLGCAAGFGWFHLFDSVYLTPPRRMDGQTTQAVIEVSSYSRDTEYGVSADGWLTLEGKPYRVRFYLNDRQTLEPGDRVEGIFRFRVTASGGEKASTYHSGLGIFLLAYSAEDPEIHSGGQVPLKYFPALAEKTLSERIAALFPEDTVGFAKALVLGDHSGLDYSADTALSVSGIRHVVAVSGLHISILWALILGLTGKHRVISAAIGAPALLLFAAVVGFSPSVTRACIMMLLLLLSLICRREYDPPTALAFAALVMLLGNPLAITSVSFQLSVASVAGIFLFSDRLYGWMAHRVDMSKKHRRRAVLLRWLFGSVSVTLGAMSLSTPLTAYYFHTVSLVGIFTNLLILWAVTMIFYGTIAACLLSVVWLPLGKGIAWGIGWLARYVLRVAKVMANLPMAAVYTRSGWIAAWLVLCYGLLAVFLIIKRKKPALFLGCAGMGLCLALLCSWAVPLMGEFRVTVLDVGQGQCVLLQSQGKTYVVDCGGDHDESAADLAAETLLSQGISRIDGFILTHSDRDHDGGAGYLLERIPADAVYLSAGQEGTLSGAENKILVGQNLVLEYGTTRITLFPAQPENSGNESSMCVLFQTENYDILITGDRTTSGEHALLEQMDFPELELLVVGHHGSKTSTGAELLTLTQPKAAAISVGADNVYGHPAQEVLDCLEECGCVVYRTDQDGTIIYRG